MGVGPLIGRPPESIVKIGQDGDVEDHYHNARQENSLVSLVSGFIDVSFQYHRDDLSLNDSSKELFGDLWSERPGPRMCSRFLFWVDTLQRICARSEMDARLWSEGLIC